jgi:hypothetical protein
VNPILRFGVYKGRRLNDAPPEYAGWLLMCYHGLAREHPEVFAAALPRAIEYLQRIASGDLPPLERPAPKPKRAPRLRLSREYVNGQIAYVVRERSNEDLI